jgi:hypothetical protein
MTVRSRTAGGGTMSERIHESEERARAHIRGGARRAIASRHVFGYIAGATAVLGLVVGFVMTTIDRTDFHTFGDRTAALTAGWLLAMLTNSLMPFAFERGESVAGAATVVGFCLTMLNI